MGILDSLFGNSPVQQPQPVAAAPVQPATPTQPMPNYNDFLQRLVAARAAEARANPGSLWNWLSGAQTDAAKAGAQADAPGAYQALQQVQSGTQNAQLGTASNIAQTGAMAGVPIDPNNIPASTAPLYEAYSKLYGMGGGASDPNATPAEQMRAFYDRMGKAYARNPQTAPLATEYFKLRDANIPKNAMVLPSGRLVDTTNSNPVMGSFGEAEAAAAKPTEVMKTDEAIRQARTQGGIDVGVHAANANKDASLDLVNGIDPKTGQPVTRTRGDIVQNGKLRLEQSLFRGAAVRAQGLARQGRKRRPRAQPRHANRQRGEWCLHW
jgi:hypothetical protein